MRSKYHDNIRHDILGLLPTRSFNAILEIGGGEFPTLRSLGAEGANELWGVDIHQPVANDFRFVHGSIEHEDIHKRVPNEYFDLILANDVLEHLVHTENFFQLVFQKLKVGGYFVCSVPNARQIRLAANLLLRGSFPRTDSGLFDRTHLRWFCKRDVIALAKATGFELVDFCSSGKLVPHLFRRSVFAEFLALQNLFLFCKRL